MKSVYGSTRWVLWGLALLVLVSTLGVGYYWGNAQTQAGSTDTPSASPSQGKILYYRNPMGLPDTSPTPKQDSMGMDYIPVYENDADTQGLVRVDNRQAQLLGVQTHRVQAQSLGRELRALGSLQVDETRLSNIGTAFDGIVTSLLVNTTGQSVAQGEILFEAHVPGMFAIELDYRQAVKRVVASATASAATKRAANLEMLGYLEELEELGVTHDEIHRLQQGGDPFDRLSFRSPASGVVLQKNIVDGSRFDAGTLLYQLADLSYLWLVVQLPEQELPHIRLGDEVRARFIATPDQSYTATVDFIYPTLDDTSRSIKLRASLANPDGRLKPGQSAEVWLRGKLRTGLAVPPHAVLDSGAQQWVLVALGEGLYQPRPVTLGERTMDWVEIVSGVEAGEDVVSHASFLIDTESRLQAALDKFGTPPEAAQDHPHQSHNHQNHNHQEHNHQDHPNHDRQNPDHQDHSEHEHSHTDGMEH